MIKKIKYIMDIELFAAFPQAHLLSKISYHQRKQSGLRNVVLLGKRLSSTGVASKGARCIRHVQMGMRHREEVSEK